MYKPGVGEIIEKIGKSEETTINQTDFIENGFGTGIPILEDKNMRKEFVNKVKRENNAKGAEHLFQKIKYLKFDIETLTYLSKYSKNAADSINEAMIEYISNNIHTDELMENLKPFCNSTNKGAKDLKMRLQGKVIDRIDRCYRPYISISETKITEGYFVNEGLGEDIPILKTPKERENFLYNLKV